MMIGIKCYEVIGICFLYVILFNCKMPVQVLFQIKFPQNRCLVLFVCFVALRPKSTAMVIAGRSVHLTTLFPRQA